MSVSIAKLTPAAVDVHCEPFVLRVTLADGRGVGVHWPDIDEDVSVSALLGAPT